MQGIMPMDLWRRAREAGRAWWAREANAPKKDEQDAEEEAQVVPVTSGAQNGCGCEDSARVVREEVPDAEEEAQVVPVPSGAQNGRGCEESARVVVEEVPGKEEEAQVIPVTSGAQNGCGCEESACVVGEENRSQKFAEVDDANAALITRLKKGRLKTEALKTENKEIARTVSTLKRFVREAEKIIIDACAPYPEALSKLLPGGTAAGSPNFVKMVRRWKPGMLMEINMQRMRGASTCARELAANGLSQGLEGFEDLEVLGTGNFGVVRAGLSKISNRKVAVKTVIDGIHQMFLVRELIAYAIIGKHENVIDVLCMSDIPGAEGLVMEAGICDLLSAVAGTSKVPFSLPKIISFEADATMGLAYLHKIGIVHIDFKLANILICRSPHSPSGFIGKVVDLGMCCGIGEARGARMGTVSHAPPEGFHTEVAASPLDDTFAVGVDMSIMLADPRKRAGAVHMWTHETLLTSDEKENLASLRLDGKDTTEFLENVTHRTMTDGSFARIMVQPCNMNRALPTGELENVCHFIRKATSVTPVDRPSMAAVTTFLRALAASTAVRPAGPPDPPAVEGGDAGPAFPPVSSGTPVNRPRMDAVTESRQALAATTATRSAGPADSPAVEDGGAGLAAEAESEGLGKERGVEHDLSEIVEMMRTVPLPFDPHRLEGGGGGGGEVAVPVFAPIQESHELHVWRPLLTPEHVTRWGNALLCPDEVGVDRDMNEVIKMVRAVPLPC